MKYYHKIGHKKSRAHGVHSALSTRNPSAEECVDVGHPPVGTLVPDEGSRCDPTEIIPSFPNDVTVLRYLRCLVFYVTPDKLLLLWLRNFHLKFGYSNPTLLTLLHYIIFTIKVNYPKKTFICNIFLLFYKKRCIKKYCFTEERN